MKALKILVTVAAVVAIAIVATPDASANCGINKFFRSGGSDSTDNVRITPGFAGQAPGNEIGRWWDSANANLSSNFGPNDGTCPSSGWWVALMSGNLYIDGILDGPGCVGYAGCPGLEMTVVIEDYGPVGPPGINDTAYYVGWRVDDTPAALRRYDYGRTDNGVPGNSVFPFLEFPEVFITGSSRNGTTMGVDINYNLADQADRVHTAFGATDDALPVSSVVAEWHLMQATGTSDPGRARSNWAQIQTIPYVPGGTPEFAEVPCADTANDSWLAVGLGFDGGAAGIINSELVGVAIQIECDPTLADPDNGFIEARPNPGGDLPFDTAPRKAGGRR
jgi:hypothetical protein